VSTLAEKHYRAKEAAWASLGTTAESVVQVKVIKTVRPWALVYCDNGTGLVQLRDLFVVVHFEQLRKAKPTEIQNEDQMMKFFFGAYAFQRSGYGFEDLHKGLISFVRDSDKSNAADFEREDKLIDILLGKERGSVVATDARDTASVEDLVPPREVEVGSSSSAKTNPSGSQKKRKAIEALAETENETSMAVDSNSGTDI